MNRNSYLCLSLLLYAMGATVPAFGQQSDDAYQAAAKIILETKGVSDRGYCLVFGAGEGRLAEAIAKKSRYTLIGAEEDEEKIKKGRAALRKAGLYGSRITLHRKSLSNLPYRNYAAALVVSDAIMSDGVCRGSAGELYRMIRPDGGMAVIGQPAGSARKLKRSTLETWLKAADITFRLIDDPKKGLWAVIRRGPLPGAGEWTHIRGDIANTASSGDKRTSDTYRILWFGQPGPRVMVDRHWKSMPPLYKKGKLIIPAYERIICSDAYNGARLWDLELKNATRTALLRDAGSLAMGETHLYMAVENKCRKVDLNDGRIADVAVLPENREWGYLAIDGDLLYGSEQIPQASYQGSRTRNRGRQGNARTRGENKSIVTSTRFFCLNRATGDRIWEYAPEGTVIANVSICVGENGVFFFESTDATARQDEDGRVKLAAFTKDKAEHLVQLDKRTGRVIWRRPHDVTAAHILYMSYAKGVLVAAGTTTGEGRFYKYHVLAFDTDRGNHLWTRTFDRTAVRSSGGRDATHGKQDRQPVISGNTVYFPDEAFDLRSGTPRGFSFQGYGCSDYTASASHLFGRVKSGQAGWWRFAEGGPGTPIDSGMRPGCGMSLIAGGGIVMMPAFGAGCMCDYTIETTAAWLPVHEK